VNTPSKRYRLADKVVRRVGYGAMQLAGPNAFGPPRDHNEAIAVLRSAVDAGVDHIDTAHYYGPAVVNELIREALYPYPDNLALVSKVGARRDEFGGHLPYNDPDQLRAGIEDNLVSLGVGQLTAVNLRLLDGAPVDERFVDQLGALVAARNEGLIAGIGISNITHQHLLRALEITDIVCVQNAFNLAGQAARPILDECTARGIAFVPFAPLGSRKDIKRCDPHQFRRHRHRRPPRRDPYPGRSCVVAGHRRQRAAHPGHQQAPTPRREPRRPVIVAAGRRNRQAHFGIQPAVRCQRVGISTNTNHHRRR
jgi:pyridoxine 4-dehydrogenase